jgi:nitrite reductase/ring-hydroxylating ferredoxin subunit
LSANATIRPRGWSPVIAASEFAVGDGGVFEVRGVPIALYLLPSGFRAVGAVCPHAGSLLSEFPTDDGTVICPSHGWEFRLDDGGCTTHATQRVVTYPARVFDGIVCVRVRPFLSLLSDCLRRANGANLAKRVR